MRITPGVLRERFVCCATQKFAANVPDFLRLQELVHRQNGRFHNDHGAIRCADPALTQLIERAANAMGMVKERSYNFPAKKLKSFDLHVPGIAVDQFKIFVSEVDLTAFPASVATAVTADCAAQAAAVDHHAFIALIALMGRQGYLSSAQADDFVQHMVLKVMHRNGAPMARALLDAVASVSPEAASALALGPDFNHVTIDVLAANFADIDTMATAMRAAGFTLLPDIQGAVGTSLRQTATMAATMPTAVTNADGSMGSAPTEKQFVEIIQRGQARYADGNLAWQDNGDPLIFKHFLASNAAAIFNAATTRSSTASC